MKEMVAAGVFPDTSTYNIIIKAAMANRDVDTAATVAKQMRANGVQPDRVGGREGKEMNREGLNPPGIPP